MIQTSSSERWKLFVDGASRGNPGPSGAGIFVQHGTEIIRKGYFLGKHTNNEAEYLALLIGMLVVKKRATPGDKIHIFSDSLLLIKQMNGEYRVRKPELSILHALVKQYAQTFSCTFTHVYREQNQEADALANVGIDTKTAVPVSFVALLRSHEFIL